MGYKEANLRYFTYLDVKGLTRVDQQVTLVDTANYRKLSVRVCDEKSAYVADRNNLTG